jgi:PST family polysaccharide transporter
MHEIPIKKAVFINAVSKYAYVLLTIVFTAVLSRILTPHDFGIVAIVTVFTAFFNLMADMGMGAAVVQDKTLTSDEINHIFTFSMYIAVVLLVVFCILGFPIAWFYHDRVYISICAILSLSLFFNTLNMIPNAILRKEKRFLLIGIRLIMVTIGTYGITIILALWGYKYYALVIQSVLSALLVFFWNLRNVKLRFKIKIDFTAIKKIWGYSGYQFGFTFINYFARNFDNLIIGKIWGNVTLAQYDKAYRFMLFPVNNLTSVISSVLHPILSKYQDNLEYIYNKYLQIIKILSLLGVFISAFCYWSSREIIILVFGNQWHEAIGCFKYLSFSIWAQMVASSAGAIYQSIGNTKLMFISGLIHVSISVIAIITGILLGNLNAFAICVSIGFIFKFFVEYFFLIQKGFGKKIGFFLYNFVPDAIVFAVLFTGLLFFVYCINKTGFSPLPLFICKLLFAVILYFFCLLFTGQWKYVKRIILK